MSLGVANTGLCNASETLLSLSGVISCDSALDGMKVLRSPDDGLIWEMDSAEAVNVTSFVAPGFNGVLEKRVFLAKSGR